MMANDFPLSPRQIDWLVREALEADAREVDLSGLQASLEARFRDTGILTVRARRRIWIRGGAVAAATLVLAAVIGEHRWFASRPASAYSLVSSANDALARGGDRCYRVEQVKLPRRWNPFLLPGDQTTVWTRGDRFHVITQRGASRLLWGQDEQQRFWGVVDSRRGLLYESREVPPALREALSCLNLDVRQLTEEILTDFDLSQEPASPGTVLVRAKLRPNTHRAHHFTAVLLDIEESSMIIRRMEVTRTAGKKELARLAFTLIDERAMPDDHYRLAGNLSSGAEVLDRSRRPARQQLFMSLMSQ